jgi:hypothetical protein
VVQVLQKSSVCFENAKEKYKVNKLR